MASFEHAHFETKADTAQLWGRKADNVAYLSAFWIDIDVDGAKANCYSTIQDAREALEAFCSKFGLPPNWIVESGAGLHVYWVLNDDIPRDRWLASARRFKEGLSRSRLKTDPCRTADATSLLRPIGTTSKKRDKQVRGQWARYGSISLEEFDSRVEALPMADKHEQQSDQHPPRTSAAVAISLDSQRWFDTLDEPGKVAAIGEMLSALPLSTCKNYQSWLTIGAALHGTNGVEQEALFEIWKSWSQQTHEWDKEKEAHHRAKWNGLNRSSIGTLIHHARQHGWRPSDSQFQEGAATVRCESLESAKDLLARNFAYARLDNKFVCKDGAILSVEAFDRTMSRQMPLDSNGRPFSAVQIATRYGAVPIVDVAGYAPGRDFLYTDKGTGQKMANRYRADETPDLEPTEAELRALAYFRKHLVSGDQDTATMLDYFDNVLAYLVQFPAQRVPKVCLLIGETQGSGKSTYTLGFTRALFGWQNVGKVTNSEIRSNFNEWMTDSRVVCLEEIWMTNRKDSRDLVNSLKDNITDEIARIHPKGGKGYQMTNPATYFASSNHLDAVDLAQGDRRWAVAHTKAGLLDARLAHWLHRWLQPGERGPSVLRHIYGRMSLVNFNPHGSVPLSRAKVEVIELSQTDIERTLKEAWDERIGPFRFDLTALEDVQQFLNARLGYSTSQKQATLALQTSAIGAIPVRAKKERQGQLMIKRIWITRNQADYSKLGPAELYTAYEEQLGARPRLTVVAP
jgi:hypothetical protein